MSRDWVAVLMRQGLWRGSHADAGTGVWFIDAAMLEILRW